MINRTTKQGTAIRNNVAIRTKYESALEQIVLQMRKDTEKELSILFCRDPADIQVKILTFDAKQDKSKSFKAKLALAALLLKFQLMFNGSAKKLAMTMFANSERYATTAVRSSLYEMTGNMLNVTPLSKIGVMKAEAIVAENVSLIKSIPQQYFTQITSTIMQAISTGVETDLQAKIVKHGDVSERRARAIASDQVHKAIQSIAIQKMLDQGVKKFQWVYTYRSKEPREYHIRRDGKIYRFDKPPGGEFPGSPINCKCVVKPVAELR
jgi:SPP1 gp7 family putative phage head morphogenesis protein